MGKPEEDDKGKLETIKYPVPVENVEETLKPKVSSTLVFYVNGHEIIDNSVNPEWTLLHYLRDKLRLTGTKLGCAEGGCGACTVMLSNYDRKDDKIHHLAVNACLAPVCSVHGMSVTTVEGIGSTRIKLHPIQERLAKAHGSQCGFCTPGIVMSMYSLLRSKPKPTMEDLESTLQGNLCRCTGYRPIIEGLRTFTEEWEQSQIAQKTCNSADNATRPCAMGDSCCKRAFSSEPNEIFNVKDFKPYDSTQEIIFPPKLKLSDELDKEYLIIKGKEVTWYRPTTLKELLILKDKFPAAKIVVGNTEIGVEVKFKNFKYPVLIQPNQLHELHVIKVDDFLEIGASLTLREIEETLHELISIHLEYKTRIFTEIIKMLHWFAGQQIRNVGAIGGNIMTGSPISDLIPIFMAAGTKLCLSSLKNGSREVKLDHTFFTGYRQSIVQPEEVLVSLKIPFTKKFEYFVAYKQAKRREDDIAIVNMAMNVKFKPETDEIAEVKLAYGGMGPITKIAMKTCERMTGKRWNSEMLESTYESLIEEFPLDDSAPGGMILYRRTLTLSLFFKAYIHISQQLQQVVPGILNIPSELASAADTFDHQPMKSSQYYQIVPEGSDPNDLVGRPIVHKSGFKHTTGEALYCDDIPRIQGELYMSLVSSRRNHAKILKINASKALSIDGVIAFFSAEDLPDDRRWVGICTADEEVFASEKVTCYGQPIGAVIAIDQITAQKAARVVEVDYEELEPVLITMEDAIAANSFIKETPKRIKHGDVDRAFADSEHLIEGEFRVGGQEHFYLEALSVLAVPKENDELEIFCSTQNPTHLQKEVAKVIGVDINRINVRVKRMGGGFGGKETRASLIALPAALAAWKLQRPVRCMLDRNEDMLMTGGRNPFLCRYKVGFNRNGLIHCIKAHLFLNAGCSRDLSNEVIERAIHHLQNAYNIPVIDVTGWSCLTNLPSNTAFRAFGAPQAMLVAENIVWDIANFLNVEPIKISELNLVKENHVTHYHQKLIDCTVNRCWQQCLLQSNYQERKMEVDEFNRANRFRKRGISVVPTIFGVGYTIPFLMQAGALVHIYTDGSVLVSHGGTEMGQGLHTKMIQVASRILKVDPDKIFISETSTDKVPNTTSTSASVASDLNGAAVMNACYTLMDRLKDLMEEHPEDSWEQLIQKAYLQRISLSATGYHRTPDIGYDYDTNTGRAYDYFSYGVTCSEVEVDCLTGDHRVRRTDIVMDVGDSLNPAIDIGQIEGAFMQGLGLFTMEELIYSRDGNLLSRGPGAYKIPGFGDIPQEFNVSLLKNSPNPRAVFSSKAVGEPPLFGAASVFFAIKNAIWAARMEHKVTERFRFDSPATAVRIRTACIDNLVCKIPRVDETKAWNIVP